MTDPSTPSAMQFDRAEYATSNALATTCALCQAAIPDSYFEVNGQTMCAGCTDELKQTHGTEPASGNLVKALGAGIGAGILGALLYYAVLALSGYEFGLIAIVVGLLVGRAVRWGSGGRGGRRYQVLAVALTYISIVSCYVPFIFQGIRNADATSTSAAATGTAAEPPRADAQPPATAGQIVIALAIFGALVLASPFLAGFENIIGWLILGFALFEAWKVNRRHHIEVTGPFAVAPAPSPGSS
jgi:hypothetical protein